MCNCVQHDVITSNRSKSRANLTQTSAVFSWQHKLALMISLRLQMLVLRNFASRVFRCLIEECVKGDLYILCLCSLLAARILFPFVFLCLLYFQLLPVCVLCCRLLFSCQLKFMRELNSANWAVNSAIYKDNLLGNCKTPEVATLCICLPPPQRICNKNCCSR